MGGYLEVEGSKNKTRKAETSKGKVSLDKESLG
ncbi:hypothetical protein ES703_15342 [subsurface metagenome]